MRISHVVRAEEHLPNTPKQQMLWEALGEEPPVWAHVPVLVNEQRKKLSKRRDKVAVEQYRDEGYPRRRDGQLPDDARLGAQWRHRDRAVGADRRATSGSRTSTTRRRSSTSRSSTAFNGEYIRALSVERVHRRCARRSSPPTMCHGQRERFNPVGVRGDGAARAERVGRWTRCPATSTSCSSPTRRSTTPRSPR